MEVENCVIAEEEDEAEGNPEVLSHQQALEEFKDGLAELIVGDPLLNDLHSQVTLEEVNALIALEHGQAITVNVRKADNSIMSVVVVQNGTVMDLKQAIKRHVMLLLSRNNSTEHISWKYIWKSYWLYFKNQKLTEDKQKLKEYGIHNRDVVLFIKKLRQK